MVEYSTYTKNTVDKNSLVMMKCLTILSFMMCWIFIQRNRYKLMFPTVPISRPITPLFSDGHEQRVNHCRLSRIVRAQNEHI